MYLGNQVHVSRTVIWARVPVRAVGRLAVAFFGGLAWADGQSEELSAASMESGLVFQHLPEGFPADPGVELFSGGANCQWAEGFPLTGVNGNVYAAAVF